jgi:hypothetical protein
MTRQQLSRLRKRKRKPNKKKGSQKDMNVNMGSVKEGNTDNGVGMELIHNAVEIIGKT